MDQKVENFNSILLQSKKDYINKILMHLKYINIDKISRENIIEEFSEELQKQKLEIFFLINNILLLFFTRFQKPYKLEENESNDFAPILSEKDTRDFNENILIKFDSNTEIYLNEVKFLTNASKLFFNILKIYNFFNQI